MSIPPIRCEIRVAATADRTFTLFTDRIGGWWPLGVRAAFGDGSVAFAFEEGVGQLRETSIRNEKRQHERLAPF